ncbi:MAG: DUF1343 domain-containing protein [candidate division WOR-3 bacterium]|nr:MAG: DUF1343 domain-containing protein [candidate division WOR-3 bacterium]
MLLGIDRLVREDFRSIRGMKIGLLSMSSCCDSRLIPTLSLLSNARKVTIAALFAPEHGFHGAVQDQKSIPDSAAGKGMRIYSMYGRTREPAPAALQKTDAVIIDLQDIGSRYYTFLWSAMLMIKEVALIGKTIFILDRPNPLNGIAVEGPVLDPAYSSFVGLYPVPVRHGMTIGEMCVMLNNTENLGADLRVVKIRGWHRRQYHDETPLFWSMPSPNMPHFTTALVYPGMCLVEGTNLSEGRGTTRPFEIFGAPWVDVERLLRELRRNDIPGAAFRPVHFMPTFHKYRGELCAGAQIYVTDRRRFKPLTAGLQIIRSLYRIFPEYFRWRDPPYEFEKKKMPFDILIGNRWIRQGIEHGASIETLEKRWMPELKKYRMARKRYLFYS